MDNNLLVVAEKLDVTVVFSDKGMAKLLDEIKTKVIAHIPDTSSEQGRKDITSLAYKITRSKTLIDDLGKSVVSDWKKKAKLIDEHRKTARDFLDDLKQMARQPLTDWEAEQAIVKEKEEAAEKERIQGRVDRLFSLNVLLPFMDVALLTETEYTDLIEKSQHAYDAEQLRIAKEAKAKEEEAERIEQVAKEQAIEAARLAKIKEDQEAIAMAQKAKEEALKAQERAIEDAKRKEAERIEREEFERKTQIEATKKARFESLQDIGFAYPFDDLGTMIDKHYSKMYDEHRKAWNEKEKALMLEKMEKERAEKMEREAREKKEKDVADLAEKARAEALRPDREKLFAFARIINGIVCPHTFKNESAKAIIDGALYELSSVADNVVKQAKEL